MTASPIPTVNVWITSYGLRGSVAPLAHANDMILEADERILPGVEHRISPDVEHGILLDADDSLLIQGWD